MKSHIVEAILAGQKLQLAQMQSDAANAKCADLSAALEAAAAAVNGMEAEASCVASGASSLRSRSDVVHLHNLLDLQKQRLQHAQLEDKHLRTKLHDASDRLQR